jgi:hypothetical protein
MIAVVANRAIHHRCASRSMSKLPRSRQTAGYELGVDICTGSSARGGSPRCQEPTGALFWSPSVDSPYWRTRVVAVAARHRRPRRLRPHHRHRRPARPIPARPLWYRSPSRWTPRSNHQRIPTPQPALLGCSRVGGQQGQIPGAGQPVPTRQFLSGGSSQELPEVSSGDRPRTTSSSPT